jgi:hypothetical protein
MSTPRPAGLDALLDHVAANLPDKERLALLDGRDALAFVVIRPADDPDRVTVEAGSRGMSKAAAAYVLRTVADEFDDAATAEGDEPIPYTLTDQADTVEEQPRRILTEDEFETAYQAARGELGMHGPRIAASLITEAIAAALATDGILTPAPEADPDTCSAMFADPQGGWHQCSDDPGHDPANDHDSGEWSWPHAVGQAEARVTPEEAAAEFDAGTALLVGEQVTAYAAAIQAATRREEADRITALGKARGWSTWAADYIHPDREFVDPGAPEDPCHPCGCPKRFNRHADGCPQAQQ